LQSHTAAVLVRNAKGMNSINPQQV